MLCLKKIEHGAGMKVMKSRCWSIWSEVMMMIKRLQVKKMKRLQKRWRTLLQSLEMKTCHPVLVKKGFEGLHDG